MMVFLEYLPMRYRLAMMESHASFITLERLSIVAIIIAVGSENTCAGVSVDSQRLRISVIYLPAKPTSSSCFRLRNVNHLQVLNTF